MTLHSDTTHKAKPVAQSSNKEVGALGLVVAASTLVALQQSNGAVKHLGHTISAAAGTTQPRADNAVTAAMLGTAAAPLKHGFWEEVGENFEKPFKAMAWLVEGTAENVKDVAGSIKKLFHSDHHGAVAPQNIKDHRPVTPKGK